MTSKPVLGLALLLIVSWTLAAEIPPLEELEAPEAIFDQKIGDVGVLLEADGTWTTRLAGGWGLGISPEATLPGLGYPGLEKGVIFTQEPDFSLTLRLLERYYLEVAYRGSLEDRSFLLGYDGQPGEPVQWVKAGNASFSVPPRAGETLPDGQRGVPAAGAAFSLGPVSLEALGRYESGQRETKTFRGFQEVSAGTVSLDSWIRDRFFRLPGPYPLRKIQILVSEGGSYREATGSEASFDLASGEIRLAASATHRFAVTWDNAIPYTSPLLGISAVPDKAAGASNWFVLVQPGTPSAFELRNRYPVAKGNISVIFLFDQNTGLPVPGYSISQSPSEEWFEVSGAEEAPFFDLAPGIYPAQTTGTPPPQPSTLAWAFQLPESDKTHSLSLGMDVLPSSLIVVRNGIATAAYRFEADTGILELDVPVFETDLLEITFQRQAAGLKASDLVLWQGGRWDLSEGSALEWNLQGRWNMEQGRYTTEDLQSPGRMATTLAWTGSAGDWNWNVSGTGGAVLADSTGHRRIYGHVDGGTQAALNGDSLRPSSAPGLIGGLLLTEASRAPLYFRDYWSNDPLTGEPQTSAWGKPGVERQPWGTGSWMGPYLVRGDGERSDRLAVVETDLNTGEWAGMQVFFDAGKPRDLGTTSAVTVTLRLDRGTTGNKVYLQAGSLSEDFDGTGTVRKVEYRAFPALAFFHSRLGAKQYFPIPEDSTWGNDAEKDGAASEDGTLVTIDLSAWGFDNTQTGWQTIRVLLTDFERQRLRRTTGWRMVVADTGGGTGSRTLLAGPVVFEGSRWSVKAVPGAAGTVHPVEQVLPSEKDGNQLRVDWAERKEWTVEARQAPVRSQSYQTLAFRYRLAALDPVQPESELTLALSDRENRGLRILWNPKVTAGWVQARVDLRTKILTLDGVPSGMVQIDSGTGSWDRMSVTQRGSPNGTWYLAEVEAVDPLWEPVGTTLVATTWKQPEPWPSTALPLISGFSLGLTSRQAGLTTEDLTWKGLATVAGTLGPFRTSGEADFIQTAQSRSGHGAYEATLPLGWPGGPSLEWTDRFSDRGLRSEKVILGIPWLGTVRAEALVEGPPETLDQKYRAQWSSPSELPEGWTASLSSEWFQTRPWNQPLGSFTDQWRDSWDWLIPPEKTAPYYFLKSQGETKATWGPWSLESEESARVSQSTGPVVKWSPASFWKLKGPLRYEGDQGWSVTPSVSQGIEAVFERTQPRAPKDSARELFDWLGSSEKIPETGMQETMFGIDWDREALSDWSDLAFPILGGTELILTRGQEKSATYESTSVGGHLQARGINLFGALGSQPVFPWYRTDVWTWSTMGSWKTGTRERDRYSDASLSTRTELILTTQESLVLPATYQGRWGAGPIQSLALKPSWSIRDDADLPFELPRWLSPSRFNRQWVQEVALSLELGWMPADSPVLRDLQVSWKGRLLISEGGELSLTTRWGQQWQKDLTVIGLEAALDLILSF